MNANKTALVTGASRGLGLALCRALAERGWSLLINARNPDDLESARSELARHATVAAVVGDVSNPGTVKKLLAAVREIGGLDMLVNNASTLGVSPLPKLLDYPVERLAPVFQVNAVAPLGLIQALRHELRPGARVLNVSSDAAVEAYEGWGGYGASKSALERISLVLAEECPEWRVYVVDPGDMRTQMHQDAFPGEDISDRPLPNTSVPGLLQLIEGDLPSGRYQARQIPAGVRR